MYHLIGSHFEYLNVRPGGPGNDPQPFPKSTPKWPDPEWSHFWLGADPEMIPKEFLEPVACEQIRVKILAEPARKISKMHIIKFSNFYSF